MTHQTILLPKSAKLIYRDQANQGIRWWMTGLFFGCVLLLFLPWTQNIQGTATVTTLRQEERPQEVNSAIDGKVVKWFVQEGQTVKAGDTLVQLQEIKLEYLDPELLKRTQEQIKAKETANLNYFNKAETAETQYQSLQEAMTLKLSQLENKISQTEVRLIADSTEYLTSSSELQIATAQLERQKQMHERGLVSLTQLEQRTQNQQNAQAKKISAEIKFINTKQDLINQKIELNSLKQEYNEKLSKVEGDRYQTLSLIASAEADIAKLQNLYSSYKLRNEMYYILAPQSGQATEIEKSGIGEIIKTGDKLLRIIPSDLEFAVELFVRPMDQPLLDKDLEVRIVFDGFPALVFGGWPDQSFGTFSGKVVAVENQVNRSGNIRVLIQSNPSYKQWPKSLRLGTGAQCIILLGNVPLAYEIWRKINGFPPEFYHSKNKN
ncbi:MAG: HlyD family efflux transporter periplasmic adaptor subunit [Saprospiraceae bacterium]|nr:HlyD family efflux transporter periplasmic adaptor subunit [Saprospiraceae bacterium]